MMYLILKDGTKVNAPPAFKSMLGMELFMELAKREGTTLFITDIVISYESILKRYSDANRVM